MTSGDDGGREPRDRSGSEVVFLADPVRRKAIEIASAALPGLAAARVPARLRRFLKFNPSKRSKLARVDIAAELAENDDFRSGLGEVLESSEAPLVKSVRDGEDLSAMHDPAEVAALAYLLRPEGWEHLVAKATEAVQSEMEERPSVSSHEESRSKLAAAEKENRKLRGALADQRSAAAKLQEDLRKARRELRESQERAAKSAGDLAAERGRLKRADADRRGERRRLEAEVEALRAQLEQLRRSDRESERLTSSRLWLLMDTLTGTASGLRRELGLEPVAERPADYVAGERCAEPDLRQGEGSRGLGQTDPQRLDHLLSLPNPHLIVDGYNVTISAWGETLTLEQQRNRLVRGLGALAVQTNAEITVVFDGADPIFGAKPSARGVRVLFSAKGEIADDVVVDLARVEPKGRPVVVVSSDREVAERARRHDAYTVPSPMLVKRLQRG